MTLAGPDTRLRRLHLRVQGAVQGVGFRPFVFRLADEMGLSGWVQNGPRGVVAEVEGDPDSLESFARRLEAERPSIAVIQSVERHWLEPTGLSGFAITESEQSGERTVLVLPDLATCDACLHDTRSPGNRRYRYPFTNCTYCGPRFSILETLPYDRPHTTMRGFTMCTECLREYEDPRDRRFHAQPNACPACGPQLALWDHAGTEVAQGDAALLQTARAITQGAIVAVKGLGGFHLMALASDADAVQRLRRRKLREEKPFALMAPDLWTIRRDCEVSRAEAELLSSPQAPIVLLERGSLRRVAENVAPDSRSLGYMLPTTPLHHLLLQAVGASVVATSGNLSDEPICIDEGEAVQRLGSIADVFLMHDRPITRPLDDSIARVTSEGVLMLRRARGYAPMPFALPNDCAGDWLAVGAQLKNTVAVSVGSMALMSQHVGDLETEGALVSFERATQDLPRLYATTPTRVVSDAHPDYASTRHAERSGLSHRHVQHHHAHVRACMLDNGVEGPLLGVAFDGTGLGSDGTIWGGEFLRIDDAVNPGGFQRFGSLRPFPLPGGDAAVREPWRTGLSLLYELFGDLAREQRLWRELNPLPPAQARLFEAALARRVHTPLTSSMGRLFDGVSALLGLCTQASFEGQAAMRLEHLAGRVAVGSEVPIHGAFADDGTWELDPRALLRHLLAEQASGRNRAELAALFHEAVSRAIVDAAYAAGIPQVALSGGCFQNRRLLERSAALLRGAGFSVLTHHRIPPNDGGIALGQLAAAMRGQKAED